MKIKGGYILQPRIIDESEVSAFPPHVREIWGYLLRRANHADVITHGTLIKRGQVKTSYRDIINDLSWFVGYRKESYKKHHCEIAMKLLVKQKMVTTTKTTRGMIVTICKYDYYQDPKNYETDNVSYNKATRKPQSNDTINKNDKNDKNVNNTTSCEKSHVTLHSLCKDLFHGKFRVLFGEEYYWEAKDAANLNAITKKIKRNRELKGLPTDDDKILFAFGAFIDSIKDRWLLENFSIPNINAKFNEIISQAKQNGHRKQQQATTDDELIESIKAGIQRGITENSVQ